MVEGFLNADSWDAEAGYLVLRIVSPSLIYIWSRKSAWKLLAFLSRTAPMPDWWIDHAARLCPQLLL